LWEQRFTRLATKGIRIRELVIWFLCNCRKADAQVTVTLRIVKVVIFTLTGISLNCKEAPDYIVLMPAGTDHKDHAVGF
jgi:hypothetical protein